jgi:hypothetical protein
MRQKEIPLSSKGNQIKFIHLLEYEKLQPGDHICREISSSPLDFHHGIYMGDKQVAEISRNTRTVKIVSIKSFMQDRGFIFVIEHVNKHVNDNSENILERVNTLVNTDYIFHSSEYFAYYCCVGSTSQYGTRSIYTVDIPISSKFFLD